MFHNNGAKVKFLLIFAQVKNLPKHIKTMLHNNGAKVKFFLIYALVKR
jgi:hypothetical protein